MSRKINHTFIDCTGEKFTFGTLNQLKSFCKQEVDFWKQTNQKLEKPLHDSYTRNSNLSGVIQTIDSWKDNLKTWDENSFQANFRNLSSFE